MLVIGEVLLLNMRQDVSVSTSLVILSKARAQRKMFRLTELCKLHITFSYGRYGFMYF
jgi:hypothetical protein